MISVLISKETIGNILVLNLPTEYFLDTTEELLNLAKSNELSDYRHIIIDCTKLESFEGGAEVYLLKEKFINIGGKHFVVCGAREWICKLWDLLGKQHPSLTYFLTRIEAMDYIQAQI